LNASNWIKRAIGITALAAAAVSVGAPAQAGSSTSTFTVSTQVNAACTVAASNLVFPTYVAGSAFVDQGSTNMTVTCPGATVATPSPVTLAFAATSGPAAFQMASGVNTINYSLCQDASCSSPFAYNTPGATVNITTGAGQAVPVYGQIAAGLVPAAGAYTQGITATMTF
jgi:spore coat protein U-like protein